MRRGREVALCIAMLVLASILTARPAAAATFNVACSTPDLIAAIEAANDETAHPGGDTLALSAGCTYTVVDPYGSDTASFGLPTITSPMVIDGNGATIQRVDLVSGSIGFFNVSSSGTLLITDMTIANGAGWQAGFIQNSGYLTVNATTFTDSNFGNNATAIVNRGTLSIVNSTLSRLGLQNGGNGGAVRNESTGTLIVVGATFANNYVLRIQGGPGLMIGGAISNAGHANISFSTFQSNRTGATGGAISNGGELTITDSSFIGGDANFGAAIDNGSDLIVERSYFEDNEAAISGGAIYNGSSALAQVVNSTFYANRARTGSGGAIANAFSFRIDQSTFAFNTAASGASAIHSTGGLVVVESSIIRDSATTHCAGDLRDFGDNFVYPGLGGCPSSFSVADPKLVTPPAAHGGPTKTIAFGAASPAVDVVTGCPTTDQRGYTRPAGAKCDSGAFEDQIPGAPGTPSVVSGGNPNRGVFTLEWSPSIDPDMTSPSYELYARDANDADFTLVGTVTVPRYVFSSSAPSPEGTFEYRVYATDGNHTSAPSSTSAAVVVDRTAPSVPVAAADRAPDYTAPGASFGWYRDTVTVTFSGSTDPALADGSAGSGVASYSAPQTFATSGAHVAQGTATDGAGNVSAPSSLTVQVDAESPVVTFTSCAPDVILGSAASATWSASDPSSGLATDASGSIALDTSTIGTRTVSASATDNVGHATTVLCTFRVIFDFTGFFRPLLDPPASNPWTAGENVPVSFSLAGDQGLSIFESGYPQSVQIPCGTSPEETAGAPTIATIRGLTYSRGSQRYSYVWRTDASWAGTCRQLIVKLVDGTYHRANFSFE